MSFPRDLLEQATHLAMREPKRPRQASLRRAISSAYYALFHLLIHDAAYNAAPNEPSGLRETVKRALSHNEMKNVCKGFISGNAAFEKCLRNHKPFQSSEPPLSTQKLLSFPLEADLVAVMNAFVELQEARHEADYNTTMTWNRVDVLTKITVASVAFSSWATVKNCANATVFKSALLLQKNWGR
jgi:uncharacterized protein (UPF0332 family)